MPDLTPILQAITALIGAIFATFVIPYIREKTTAVQQAKLYTMVRVAVAAAEQLYRSSGDDSGTRKKIYVVEFLKSLGLYADDAEMDALIEAAVYEINNPKATE